MLSSVADPKDEVKLALDRVTTYQNNKYYVEAVLLNVLTLSRTARHGSISITTSEGNSIAISSDNLKKDEIRTELENSIQKKYLDINSIKSNTDDMIKKIVLRNVVNATYCALEHASRIPKCKKRRPSKDEEENEEALKKLKKKKRNSNKI